MSKTLTLSDEDFDVLEGVFADAVTADIEDLERIKNAPESDGYTDEDVDDAVQYHERLVAAHERFQAATATPQEG